MLFSKCCICRTVTVCIAEPKKGRQAVKVAKGTHSSSNAYMLVYCRKDSTQVDPNSLLLNGILDLPSWVLKSVDCENDNFEAWNRDVHLRKVCFRSNFQRNCATYFRSSIRSSLAIRIFIL